MADDVTEVTSLSQYIEVLKKIDQWKKNTAPWFRGEGKGGRELTPGLLRRPFSHGAKHKENDLTILFKEHAPAYLKTLPDSWIDWQVLMQHHGCPTRLLDWTESALVALYFAVKRMGKGEANTGDNVDGTVYVLDANRLSDMGGFEGKILAGDRLRSEEGMMKEGFFQHPIPLLPKYNTPRALAQKSRFTLYPLGLAKLEPPVLSSITIPGGAKRDICWELKTAGITASTLFPDLDGLARELRSTVSHGEDSGW